MRLLIAHKSSTSRTALAGAVPQDDHDPVEIVEVADGRGALESLLGEDAPALAVIDWDLPGIDAPELCRLVRDFHLSRPPHIVVLAGSAHDDTRDALGAGAAECVRTPAPAAAIRERLEAHLRAVREKQAAGERYAVRTTLEALCSHDAVDVLGFASPDQRPELDLDPAAEPVRQMTEPCDAAVLEAVLRQG